MSAKIRHGVKRRISLDPSERPQKAVDLTIKNIPTESLCGTDIRQSTFVAKRKKLSKKPPQPRSDLELNEAWVELMFGERKVEGSELVLDICEDIVMLGSTMGLILMQENSYQLFCDGTFKYAANGYFQLYTIHVIVNTTVYTPVIHFLLKNKQCTTYTKMFKMLLHHCPELKVAIFQMDFELAAQQAAAAVFPEAEIRGCRFHLAQAWFRKLTKLGLQTTYQRCHSQAAIWLKTVFGLPGLPPTAVEPFFTKELLPIAPNNSKIRAFAKYLIDTYVGKDAKFAPIMWAGIMDGDRRHTTNGCEGWHRHFGRGFVSPHPNIYDFLGVLSMANKRAMLKSKVKDTAAIMNAAKLTRAMDTLKNDHDSNQIDSLTFVKLVSLNLISAKRKKKNSKRSKSLIDSIKQKYSKKVNRILGRFKH